MDTEQKSSVVESDDNPSTESASPELSQSGSKQPVAVTEVASDSSAETQSPVVPNEKFPTFAGITVKPRGQNSPAIAALFSLFVYPGAGQMLNRRWLLGTMLALLFTITLVFFAVYAVCTFQDLYAVQSTCYKFVYMFGREFALTPAMISLFWWGVACLFVYFLSAVEAYIDAYRMRQDG